MRLLSGGGVRILLGESSVEMQKDDGDNAENMSNGNSPGIEIGVVIFCFRLGDSILLQSC